MCLQWAEYLNSHVVVEELLQLLVDKVDGDLLKAVVLKDLKASNVEHSTEVGLFLRRNSEKSASIDFIFDSDLNTGMSTDHSGVDQSLVTFLNQPLEDSVEDGPEFSTYLKTGFKWNLLCFKPGNTTNGICRLLAGLTLHHLNDLIVIPSGMGVVWDGCTQ